uniref:TAP-C domain-containing protein n=1 Tax=Mesocestoides corti TaxID=53468 RepID=A0A5K3ETZ4_MESCO
MGKTQRSRRREKRRLEYGSGDESPKPKGLPLFPTKSQSYREKRKARKLSLKKGKCEFSNLCREFACAGVEIASIVQLPAGQPSSLLPKELGGWSYAFIKKLLDAFEHKGEASVFLDLYSYDACVTVQVVPYAVEKCAPIGINNVTNRQALKEFPQIRSMLPYVLLSANLLKGCCPLPAWVWAHINADKKTNLTRDHRKLLLSLNGLQDLNAKYINKQVKRHNPASVSCLSGSHSSVNFARGPREIERLFTQMPLLIAIRDDATSQVDITSHGPLGVFVKFTTLCLEVVSEQAINRSSVLLHAPIARWVQRTMIVQPPPVEKIVNEDICVIPVSEQMQYVSIVSRISNISASLLTNVH